MSVKTLSLERINEQLIREGRKLGGQIPYKLVTEVLSKNQESITIEALDYIYNSLSREGIELVDQLSSHSQIKAQKVTASKYRRSKKNLSKSNRTSSILCFEDALDWLLLKAETQILCEKDLLTVINRCRLSIVLVEQLLDYLTLKGIDIPKINLSLLRFAEESELSVLHDSLLRYLSN
jgi:hypothetical protein